MKDFTSIAPYIGGSLHRLEELLKTQGFVQSEGLSPAIKGGYSSETWLRLEKEEFLAVRIDWLGHSHAQGAHYHLESFPVAKRLEYEHALGINSTSRRSIGFKRFDPFTGMPCEKDPHAPLLRDDK